MHSLGHRRLQTNPRLVAWPGDELVWFLTDDDGAPGRRLRLPDQAVAALRAFVLPRAPVEAFGAAASEATAAALDECLAEELLVIAPDSGGVAPAPATARWAGFRFVDHASADAAGTTAAPARRCEIGGRRLAVYDHVVPAGWIVAIHRWMFQLAYRRVDVDTRESAHARHWISEFKPVERYADAIPVFGRLRELALALAERPATLRRISAYSTEYGDVLVPHRDLEHGAGLTAVYYGNAEWRDSWTGETIFYDERDEPAIAVAPRPGRLALFDGSILHRGGAPSRECTEARYSLVLKFSVP